MTNSTPWKSQLKNVILASLGAVVMAEKEVENFLRKATHRGDLDPKEAEEIQREVDEILRQKRGDAPSPESPPEEEKFKERLKEKIRSQVNRQSWATSQDIRDLCRRLEEVNRELVRRRPPEEDSQSSQ